MITNDYKNGYNNHKPAHCATSKREISRAEMFLVDTVVGLLGASVLITPYFLFIYL